MGKTQLAWKANGIWHWNLNIQTSIKSLLCRYYLNFDPSHGGVRFYTQRHSVSAIQAASSNDNKSVEAALREELDHFTGRKIYTMMFTRQLIDAIRAENVDTLRAVFSQARDEDGHLLVVPDNDIHKALYFAAQNGFLNSCRILWEKLSRRGKRMCFKARGIVRYDSLLHAAVQMGHLEVVRFFIEQLKWNINQVNWDGQTPLCYACSLLFDEQRQHPETARYFLENGANVNQGGKYGPLWFAVYHNNTEVARLLLMEYHANPNLNRRPVNEEEETVDHGLYPRNTDLAIRNGNIEILRMLLECGAWVFHSMNLRNGTSLNFLLGHHQKSRETKITIGRILIAHAKEDHATATYVQVAFEYAIKKQSDNNDEECQILLTAGFDPRRSMYCAIRAKNISICQLLVNEYRVDPFLRQTDENDDGDDDEQTVSPFVAAARLADTTILEYFMELWDERFASSSNGGKNGNGDYPIHVACCDPHVSIQAIQLLVNRHPDALALVDGEEGLLPLHFAANWGACLDVIFFLLQRCPDALSHRAGNAAASLPAVVVDSSNATATATTTTMDETLDLGNNDYHGPPKKKAKTTTTR